MDVQWYAKVTMQFINIIFYFIIAMVVDISSGVEMGRYALNKPVNVLNRRFENWKDWELGWVRARQLRELGLIKIGTVKLKMWYFESNDSIESNESK